ncbi:MAG: hypothetical protein AB7V20_14065 [Phycisphaerales bacterium]
MAPVYAIQGVDASNVRITISIDVPAADAEHAANIVRNILAAANGGGTGIPTRAALLRAIPPNDQLLPDNGDTRRGYQLRWSHAGDTSYGSRQYQTITAAIEAAERVRAKIPDAVCSLWCRDASDWRVSNGEVAEGREYRIAMTRTSWTSWRTVYRGAAGARNVIARNSDPDATLRIAERDILSGWYQLDANLEAVA